jgi:Fe-Mn family superoxide dismutase
MSISTPELPYGRDALAPHISEETLNFHFGKHHMGYFNKLSAAIEGDASLQGKSLIELIRSCSGGTFNNAAQVWNHSFYWDSMSPNGGGEPTGAIADAITASFGSFAEFKTAFGAAAAGQFGSGWAWLVKNADGSLAITTTGNAETPVTDASVTPLLTCDVWEHAYYVDYRNDRGGYVNAWWSLVNWDFANANLG